MILDQNGVKVQEEIIKFYDSGGTYRGNIYGHTVGYLRISAADYVGLIAPVR
jgi:hypothetical protein